MWHLDLSSYDSVKEFSAKVQSLDRVDAIIENAGIAIAECTIVEGLEATLTVNVLSTMLLAVLVLPKLQESARKYGIVPHLVLVGSAVAFQAKGELEKIDGDLIDGVSQSPMSGNRSVSFHLNNEKRKLTLINTQVPSIQADPLLCYARVLYSSSVF